MPNAVETEFTNLRGQKLYAVEYVPDTSEPFAVLTWHHGLAEHIGRYAYVFTKVAEAGVAVYGFDAHGHGKSEPFTENERVLVNDFGHLVDDYCQLVARVQERHGAACPVFVGGHSMGGLVAVEALLRGEWRCSGLILSSPAIHVDLNAKLKLLVAVSGLLTKVAPKGRIVKVVNVEDLNPEKELQEEYVKDPLVLVGNARTMTAYQILLAMRDVQKREQGISVPLFMFHGSDDKVTSIKGPQRLLKTVGSSDTRLHVVTGGYHELLMNPRHRDGLIQELLGWIGAHAPKPKF